MRFFPLAALLVAACSQDTAAPDLATGRYAGEGRNRLCIAGDAPGRRAGVIAYGAGDANCSASGRLEQGAAGWMLVPRGETECRIPLAVTGGEVRIGEVPAACSYYCGPGATLSGKAFAQDPRAAPVTDFAGDPLC